MPNESTAAAHDRRTFNMYVLDAQPGVRTTTVRVVPEGAPRFLTAKYDFVRWHNLTSWEYVTIVDIQPDPDYDLATQSYTHEPPRHSVSGAPSFRKVGPIARGTGKLMGLKPTVYKKGLLYMYNVAGSQTASGGAKVLGVVGWKHDPHFILI